MRSNSCYCTLTLVFSGWGNDWFYFLSTLTAFAIGICNFHHQNKTQMNLFSLKRKKIWKTVWLLLYIRIYIYIFDRIENRVSDICTPTFIAVLFIMTERKKQPKCSSTDYEYIKGGQQIQWNIIQFKKKKRNSGTCYNISGDSRLGEIGQDKTLYESTSLRVLEQSDSETESKMMVAWGWGWGRREWRAVLFNG